MTKPLTVLFLSTGNGARSILAEALLRQKGGSRFRAWSAGSNPIKYVHPHALALLAAEGIPIEGLHSKGWGEFLAAANILKIDVIVTLSEHARLESPTWPGEPVRVHWPVDDPLSAEKAEVMEWKFRKCFNTLEARIGALVKNRAAQNTHELLLQLKAIGMVV
ncbi:MAG TPA: arsenate reductase ArsC [Alphaproteobacteria bacterium]|nr:arsenate reductase ArsC [Alphaproteobacteria bacterium]